MKIKSLIKLLVLVIVVAVLSLWAFGGFDGQGITIDITRFKPWYEGVKLGMDIQGGVTIVYQAQPKEGVDLNNGIDAVVKVMLDRLGKKGYTEAQVVKQGTDRIRVEVAGVDSPDQVFSLLGSSGVLEFKDCDGNVVATGEQLITSQTNVVLNDKNQYAVAFALNSEGAASFKKATEKALAQTDSSKKYIAIYLDGELYSQPTVSEVISDGKGQITTSSAESADNLSVILQSGSMPLTIQEHSAKTVSATLGSEALDKVLLAALIGVILVLVFMLVVYRFQGLVADLALFIYILIFYWFISQFPWLQLTLPSIAGIVLSIGMAVDANVVIFERIKDEFRAGRKLEDAVQTGYSKALTAIIDANVTTIIAGIVMVLPFSPAPVQNFAVTLLAGVIISMITALFITRWLYKLFMGLGVKSPKVLGLTVKKGDE